MTTQTVIFFGAHPDDETILTGGTLALLAQRGFRVVVVCATRGEGGEVGEPPVTDNRHQLGVIRETELRCACQALGVDEVIFLPYQDPVIGPGEELYAFEHDLDTLLAQVQDILMRYQPLLVLSHGSDGEYGHPAHRLLHQVTLQTVQSAPSSPLLYSVAAQVPGIEDRLWNQSDPAHLAIDITSWAEIKLAAATCHLSQHALFKRRRKLTSIRDALRLVEGFYRHWPPPDTAPNDVFAALMLEAGAWRPDHTGATQREIHD
ncbi:MAG: PIG-L family deacetylase [Chloroflexi bacterium]|nr:PIG-L family deacetylase [Chloroflexota bacterium]